MNGSHQAALQRALSIRLNLQISVSALPIVEEWMDIHMTRWMESIPLPPEMPSGHNAHFAVRLASDLSRLTWGAYGNPAGFIPKMAKYLEACKISSDDIALIDAMGNGLEPELVGSWISVVNGAIATGWHFCDEHAFAEIAPNFSDGEGKARLLAWLASARVERFGRFVQQIGEHPASTIDFPLQGVAIDDRLDAAAQAFVALGGVPLPEVVRDAMSSAAAVDLAVGVRMEGGQIVAVSLSAPGLGNDVVARLCRELGLRFDDKHQRLQSAFGADGADRVEYTRVLAPMGTPGPEGQGAEVAPAAGPVEQVDLVLIPSGNEPPRAPNESN
jgi:hypothetical protein